MYDIAPAVLLLLFDSCPSTELLFIYNFVLVRVRELLKMLLSD